MIRAVALLYACYLILPMVLLLIGSLGESWTNTLLPSGLTGRWYLELWQDGTYRRAFVNSLLVAGGTCVLNTLLALPMAYSLYHRSLRAGSSIGRLVAAMPVAVPTITLGFGYIIVFNTDLTPWLGSMPLLIAVHAIATLPYLVHVLLADLQHQRLEQLEQAAATLGASEWQQFLTVVLPSLRHSLVSGLIMVAALSIGEFNLSNLLTVMQTQTYPVALLQAFYGATGFACAATIVLLALAALSSLLSSSSVKPV